MNDFHSNANKIYFHKKGGALGLILKVRVFGTRKWPICQGLKPSFFLKLASCLFSIMVSVCLYLMRRRKRIPLYLTFNMDKLGKMRRHYWKESLKMSKFCEV